MKNNFRPSRRAAAKSILFLLGCTSVLASEPLVAQIRAAGLRVLAYTVNDPARARLLAQWGVDMICTDRIDRLQHDMLSTPANPA